MRPNIKVINTGVWPLRLLVGNGGALIVVYAACPCNVCVLIPTLFSHLSTLSCALQGIPRCVIHGDSGWRAVFQLIGKALRSGAMSSWTPNYAVKVALRTIDSLRWLKAMHG